MSSGPSKDVQDELITLIHLKKLNLVIKYGPSIVKRWAPRIRNVQ